LLLVGSGNRHKLDELRSLLADLPVAVVGAEWLPDGGEIVEDGETFAENVAIKAREYARRAASLSADRRPRWVVADDSGLCVDALGGAPGVRSARYAGDGATYADNNRKLLAALAGRPAAERGAHFVCTVACAAVPPAADREPELLFIVEGTCEGTIATAPRGAGGFGFDPVFIERTTGRTFAELDPETKNRLSHRGSALRRFRERFRSILAAGP
jgi:XTP/dITP diphosphohydrolase